MKKRTARPKVGTKKESVSEPKKSDPAQLKAKLISNIQKKVDAGKTVSVSEMKMLREFVAVGSAEAMTGVEWVGSYEQLGELLGCHRASFPRWRRSYLDCPKPRADGQHSVTAWREFFKAHPEIRGPGDITVEMQLLELEDMRQRVRKAVHLNDVREGMFTRNEVFSAQIAKTIAAVKELLRRKFEHELPGYSARQDAAQVRVLNKRAIDEAFALAGELSPDWKI